MTQKIIKKDSIEIISFLIYRMDLLIHQKLVKPIFNRHHYLIINNRIAIQMNKSQADQLIIKD